MKIKAHHRRDFSVYLRWRREWNSTFLPCDRRLTARGRRSALAAFVSLESCGDEKLILVRQPLTLNAVLEGKQLLNLQIKQWAAMLADAFFIGLIWAVDAMRQLKHELTWLPAWVWKATWNQAVRIARRANAIGVWRFAGNS